MSLITEGYDNETVTGCHNVGNHLHLEIIHGENLVPNYTVAILSYSHTIQS